MWRDIKKIIHQHHHFLLTTHVNPDGDGIGAACALAKLLRLMGKNVRFVCDGPIPSKFSFLDFYGCHESYNPKKSYQETEVVIVLDTHRKDRIGAIAKLTENPKILTICVDHHQPSELFTPYNAIDPKACSAGAMIYTLYKECGYELDLQAATGIYVSVICDTGRFCYASTSRKAHKIADECIKLGVDPDLMYSRLFQHVPLAQMRMLVKALQRMEIHLENRVVVQQIFREDYEMENEEILDIEHADLEYLLEFNKMIEDIQCVVLLRELADNQVRVSLRSTSDIDVSLLMKPFGGGGHAKAAGATWKGSLQVAKSQILELIDHALKLPVSYN